MNETAEDPTATAHPFPAGPSEEAKPGRDLPWFWIAASPVLLAALALLVGGFWLLFGATQPPGATRLPDAWGGIDLVAIGVALLVGPAGLHAALVDRRRRRLEEQFPDFLTDLAANRQAGFTLASSVRLAASSDYGPLTPHVKRMAAQLSWNVPFEEALERFAEQVDTPLVERSITLVREAERSGGHIVDVLAAVARDAREIKRLDRDRRLSMRVYTLVMYVTFLVFLGVVAVLQVQLLPQLVGVADQASGPLADIAGGGTTLEAHRTFFYTASVVQALGTGSMAGVMARGRLAPGLIHAAAMTLGAVLAFSVLLV